MKAPGDELLALVCQYGTVRLHHAGQGRDDAGFQQPLHPLHHEILLVLRGRHWKGISPLVVAIPLTTAKPGWRAKQFQPQRQET